MSAGDQPSRSRALLRVDLQIAEQTPRPIAAAGQRANGQQRRWRDGKKRVRAYP